MPRWWPLEIRLRGSPPHLLNSLLADRPSTIVGLLSDLARDRKQAFTLAFAAGYVMLIATACIAAIILVAAFFVVATAAKGVKGIPLHYILPAGIGGASLITLTTTLIRIKIKKLRASRADAGSDGNP